MVGRGTGDGGRRALQWRVHEGDFGAEVVMTGEAFFCLGVWNLRFIIFSCVIHKLFKITLKLRDCVANIY